MISRVAWIYGTAVLAVLFAAAFSFFILDQYAEAPLLPFLPAILIAAYVGGVGPAILASLLSALIAITVVEPRYALAIDDRIQILGVVILAFAGIGVGAMVERLRRRVVRAQEAEAIKGLLLKEVQHRIANNLQLVSAMIGIEAQRTTDLRTRAGLEEIIARIGTLGRLYRRLGGAIEERVRFGDFLSQVCRDLAGATGQARIHCRVDGVDLVLEPDRAIPLALIANELVTNAAKYAFADDQQGNIWVTLRNAPDGMLVLEVTDDGIGPQPRDASGQGGGLGMRLVESLAAQFAGRLTVEPRNGGTGTTAAMTFPAP